LPGSPYVIPKALTAIQQSVPQKLPGHMCTGPVAVERRQGGPGARVRIKDIELHYDWGYNMIRPLSGALPDDFDTPTLIHIRSTRARTPASFPGRLELPLAPFFGVMAVRRRRLGMILTLPPRRRRQSRQQGTGQRHHAYLPIYVDARCFPAPGKLAGVLALVERDVDQPSGCRNHRGALH